jgi:hypothetical protein
VGSAKRYMEEQEHLEAIAKAIAVEADVLESCGDHGVEFHGPCDIDDAFSLAEKKFSNGDDMISGFDSLQELIEAIQSVVDANGMDVCNTCESRKYS